MSQQYTDPGVGSSASSRPVKSSTHSLTSDDHDLPTMPPTRPEYLTVGSGSTPASAAALTALLDADSGYGSVVEGSGRTSGREGWHPGLTTDLPTPPHVNVLPGQTNPAAEHERRVLASHVHQLFYNQNRVALGRAINRTIDTLRSLQEKNSEWPAHYPSVQRPEPAPTADRADPRPNLAHTHSTIAATAAGDETSAAKVPRPGSLRRAHTTGAVDEAQASSEADAASEAGSEPRLITPQIAHDFSVLKIDLNLGALSQSELVHSLEKGSVAALLDGKIGQSIRHLLALRERIEDTSSKVLVTGDLNAGKSTFCNALLRRKVLPTDQQPCTNLFCEVLDARENGGAEEVHAVHKEKRYSRHDESTYDVYRLAELDKIVGDNDRYTQAKVYVKDIRSIDQSLLNNGVVDISIIDAPGLNLDSLKTTAVFARQEEIDVVVFVVSAANHFTLSAKEFIRNAAREKAYIFIVVNGFDSIRDKERCERLVLEQVAGLSPRTFKESSELVHFVSSNAVPVAGLGELLVGGGGGGGSMPPGGGDGRPGDDADDEEARGNEGAKGHAAKKDKGKDKEEEVRDFEDLEQALRRFVLEKRARSKLAPAKTYLLNVLGDVNTLATVNRDVAQAELDRVSRELEQLEPVFERSKKARTEVSEDIDRTIDETCAEIYEHTRTTLSRTISRVAEEELGVPYRGVWDAFQYAEEVQAAMLEQISETVSGCEEHARDRSVQGVSSIDELGHLHLGEDHVAMSFRSKVMFRSRRDALARQVETRVEIWDFVDLNGLVQRQEKVAGTGMAMTVVGLVGGRMVGGVGWMDGALGALKILGSKGIRQMIVPGLIVAVLAATSYVIHAIPTTLPRTLSAKLSRSLQGIDYTHANATRISNEVRKVLRYPADHLRVGLQRSVEKLVARRTETDRVRGESRVARKYFANLLRDVSDLYAAVDGVDLDGPAPGVAGGFDSGVVGA